MKKFIITAVDTSDTADGKARVLKAVNTKQEALDFVKGDMEAFVADADGMELKVDYNKMSIATEDGNFGCEWNFEEVEIPATEQEEKMKTLKEGIHKILNRYFEGGYKGDKGVGENPDYDPNYMITDAMDDLIAMCSENL